jgi:hypothetical protein
MLGGGAEKVECIAFHNDDGGQPNSKGESNRNSNGNSVTCKVDGG